MKLFSQKVALFVIFAVAATSGFGQKQAKADVVETNLRNHLRYLASESMEGRRTGEKGATAAAGYVANQFAKVKLKPGVKAAKGKGNFLQKFPYTSGVTATDKNAIDLAAAGAKAFNSTMLGVNFQPFANSVGGSVSRSDLVFAGFGITTRDKSFDDYDGLDATGKTVLAFAANPDAGNPHSAFGSFNIHTKANIAKENGAKALVLIAGENSFGQDPNSKLIYEPTIGETSIPVVFIDRETAAKVVKAKDIKELAEIEKWLAMRASAPPAIKIKLAEPLKGKVSLTVDLTKNVADAYNVIGVLEGRDATLKNEYIVIGAHYDHLGRGGRSSLAANSKDIHFGADDNASGTSAIIEIARQMVKEKNNKRSIIFMAFGGEEEGLLGSKYFVNNPTVQIENIVAMLNLDMVGRLKDNKLTVGGIGTANEMKELVSSLSKANDTNLFDLQLNEDGFGPSDHASFYGKKIPVLFFFTGTHADYHKPTDTFEKINYKGLTDITNFVANIARSIDQNAARPTYKVAQSSSGMATRTSFNVSLGTIPSYAETGDGLMLDGVRDGSAAAKAGLKGGDKIVKLAGKDVKNISDYMFAMSTMKAGDTYEVVAVRGGQTITLKIIPDPAARRN